MGRGNFDEMFSDDVTTDSKPLFKNKVYFDGHKNKLCSVLMFVFKNMVPQLALGTIIEDVLGELFQISCKWSDGIGIPTKKRTSEQKKGEGSLSSMKRCINAQMSSFFNIS